MRPRLTVNGPKPRTSPLVALSISTRTRARAETITPSSVRRPSGAIATSVSKSSGSSSHSSAVSDGVVAAAILLGDQPHVTSTLVDAVVTEFLAGDAAAVRPVWHAADGTPQPGHTVVLARRVWPAIAVLLGDQGARTLFEQHPDWVRLLPMVGAAPTDIDDPADFRRVASGG